ncbi:Uncharacterized protein Rs2_47854 [Raphanus sativus]|nr:Uncharacterized protein Rs2_47854 [Raphanus sativus]
MALANTNVDFPDVFGDVCGIKTTFNNDNQAIQCLKVNRRCSFGVGFSCCYPWKAGTNLYFDNEYLAGQSVLAVRLYGSDDGNSSTASKYVGVKKIEPVTLAELNNYVLNSPPHSASESLQQAALPRCNQDTIMQTLTFQLELSEIHFFTSGTYF